MTNAISCVTIFLNDLLKSLARLDEVLLYFAIFIYFTTSQLHTKWICNVLIICLSLKVLFVNIGLLQPLRFNHTDTMIWLQSL